MQLSKSLIAKFRQTHLEEFGYALSAKAAEEELLGLAELVEITAHVQYAADNGAKDGEENEA